MAKPIHQIIADVLRLHGRPMTVQEIYAEIERKQLYSFKAKSALQIVRAQLRRHCQSFNLSSAPAQKYFTLTDDGKFDLLAQPVAARDGK